MCGIYGYIETKQTKKHMPEFIRSIGETENSGRHSCGIYIELWTKDKQKTPKLYRSIGLLSNLLSKPEVQEDIRNARFILCHTRQASVGTINLENCQPFNVNPYIFLHNGHINGLGTPDISDSNILSKILQRGGIKAIKAYLQKGWANLAIYNMDNRRLILSPDTINNRIVKLEYKDRLFFASDKAWFIPLNASDRRIKRVTASVDINTRNLKRRTVKGFRTAPAVYSTTPKDKTVYKDYADYYEQEVERGYIIDDSGVVQSHKDYKRFINRYR